MTLGNVRIRLNNPGMAILEIGLHEDRTRLAVQRVIDGEWFTIALLEQISQEERHAPASAAGNRLRELVEVLKTNTNRGIPESEKEFVERVLPALLARTAVRSPYGSSIQTHEHIHFFYKDADKPFWTDMVHSLELITKTVPAPSLV